MRTPAPFALVALALVAAACDPPPVETPTGRALVRVTGIPDENPTQLQRKVQPLVEFLSQALDADVRYIPVTDYGAAVQALAGGHVDFAWLGGFTFVQARNMTDVEPLVMRGIDRNFQSVFIAGADSGIRKLEDLRGKSFAFGAKSSTSGHLMPRHFLQVELGLVPETDFAGPPLYSGAHDATAKMVESGKVAAGVLNKEVWERLLRDAAVDTGRVAPFWTTPPYVDYVWAARRDLPEALRRRFAAAFLSLDGADPVHRGVLALQGAQRFVPAHASDFDAIEEIARKTGLLTARRKM